jgi:hypothetical protein
VSEVVEDVEVIEGRLFDHLAVLGNLDYLGLGIGFAVKVGLTSLRVTESILAIAEAALRSAAAPAPLRLAAGGSGVSGSA